MKPIANYLVGMVEEEPTDFDHGKLIGIKPTFFLRVFYPMRKEGWTKDPDMVCGESARTRRFPFVIAPSILPAIQQGAPWGGKFVLVTYYPDIVERNKEADYAVMLTAVRVESLVADFPQSVVNTEGLWLDSNVLGREVDDVVL